MIHAISIMLFKARAHGRRAGADRAALPGARRHRAERRGVNR